MMKSAPIGWRARGSVTSTSGLLMAVPRSASSSATAAAPRRELALVLLRELHHRVRVFVAGLAVAPHQGFDRIAGLDPGIAERRLRVRFFRGLLQELELLRVGVGPFGMHGPGARRRQIGN